MPDIEWRYLRTGKRKHAVRRNYGSMGGGFDYVAVCGASPDPLAGGEWLGTGSQDEYDRAADLPACGHCTRHVRGPDGSRTRTQAERAHPWAKWRRQAARDAG